MQPLPLPHIASETARRLNHLVGQRRAIKFDWDGQRATLRFTLPKPTLPPVCQAVFTCNQVELNLFLDTLPEIGQLSTRFAGINTKGIPRELTHALLAAALEPMLELAHKHGADLQFVEFIDHPPGNDLTTSETLGFQIDRGPHPGWITGHLTAEPKLLQFLSERLATQPSAPSTLFKTLPFDLTFVRSAFPCPVADLEQLEVGDLLLSPTRMLTNQVEIWIAGTPCGTGVADREKINVREIGPPRRPVATAKPELPTTEVNFVVGKTTLVAEDIAGLRPGITIHIETPITEETEIHVNNRRIAAGEWIAFGNRAGVRIGTFS